MSLRSGASGAGPGFLLGPGRGAMRRYEDDRWKSGLQRPRDATLLLGEGGTAGDEANSCGCGVPVEWAGTRVHRACILNMV